MSQDKFLIIGAAGQIGTVLTQTLRKTHGYNKVIATDIRDGEPGDACFEKLDVLDIARMAEIVNKHRITQIYHLAAILSAKGEAAPLRTWEINMKGLFNVLEVAREMNVAKVFFPSSIAVFGEGAPKDNTPQDAVLKPTTVYGISKVAGELWGQYYWERYGLDVRSLRYPGVIGHQSEPGGGTTDYAVEIFHKAMSGQPFVCFLKPDTCLPMIYMDDAIRATLMLMDAPAEKLRVRTSYNVAGMSFTLAEIAASIQKRIPTFKVSYEPDFRQAIAESWPHSIDDSEARRDWGWEPAYDLEKMTGDMIAHLQMRYAIQNC
ncbi:MAG: NAD-dependent epimerase [Saprospirales bacterium]|nr:NAD-dependent epimerase [Saprospirales bacterium]